MSEYAKRLVEQRQQAWHAAKAKMDEAAAEKRDLTAEENEFVSRTIAELDSKRAIIDEIMATEKRERELSEAIAGAPVEVRGSNDASMLTKILKGEVRGHVFNFETRDLTTGTSNGPIKVTYADRVIDQARMVGPLLDPAIVTVLNTAGGENIVLPSLSTFSTAVTTGEGTQITEADPAFNRSTLKAYKVDFITQVSSELLADGALSAAALEQFLATQAGNAIGYKANNLLTLGTGTNTVQGIVPAAGSGVTGSTAVSGAFTGDNLIDLVYSLDGAARMLPGVGWMMNGASIGAARKLKASTSGEYLFTPTLDAATPDRLLGYPIRENPHMASTGTANKSVIFGHLPSFYTRVVGGLQVARSDDFAFDTDLVTLRYILRVDGALPQSSHVKYFVGGAS